MKLTSYWKKRLDYHMKSLDRLERSEPPSPGQLPKGLDRRARVEWQIRFSMYSRHHRKFRKHLRVAVYCQKRIEALKNRTFWDVLDRGIGV